MLKKFTVVLFLLATSLSYSQIPTWTWAVNSNCSGDDYGRSIVADASGNVYVAGVYYGSPITIGSTTLTNAGGSDIYLVKYSSTGAVLWAEDIGAGQHDEVTGIALDPSGNNIYITGHFLSPSLNFGGITLTNIDPVNVFIAKYSSGGSVIWAKKAGAMGGAITSNMSSVGIATNDFGDVFITGWFTDTHITFETITLTNSENSTYDAFVAKYNETGVPIWATAVGGLGSEFSYGISADTLGNVYVTGSYNSSSITEGISTITNAGGYDVFFASYNSTGGNNWLKSAGGINNDEGYGITCASGYVYGTGYYESPSFYFGSAFISNFGIQNIFVLKLDYASNIIFGAQYGGNGYDYGRSINISADGKILLAGGYSSASISFGGTTLTNALAGGGTTDIFLAQLTPQAGSSIWAATAGGVDYDIPQHVGSDAFGNTLLTGFFRSPEIYFGGITLTLSPGAAVYDSFVSSLNTSTGVELSVGSISFSVNPNPADRSLVINHHSLRNGNYELKIFDLMGKEILKSEVIPIAGGSQKSELDVSKFENGIYFFQISSEGSFAIQKIMIAH